MVVSCHLDTWFEIQHLVWPSSWHMHHVSIALVQDLNSVPPLAIICQILGGQKLFEVLDTIGREQDLPFQAVFASLARRRVAPHSLLASVGLDLLRELIDTLHTGWVEEGPLSQSIAPFIRAYLITKHVFQQKQALHSTTIHKV